MNERELMEQTISVTRTGIAAGQTPFGAVIARDGELIVSAHNIVWQSTDPTAHAEINAIRQAALALNTIDLSDCEMWTSCEPCPMCLSAIHWSKLKRVVYGATIEDAATAGFSELHMPAKELAKVGGSSLIVEQGALREECRKLFDEWKQANLSDTY